MAKGGATCDLTRCSVIQAKRNNIRESIPVLGIFGQMKRRGMLHVRYARDVWRTNGLRIRIRLVVLSNFHVQSIFIRATDYLILIFKDLNNS